MRVLKFFLFPIVHRRLFDGKEPSQGTIGTKATAAALASIPEGLTIAPIETAKIGLQLDKTNKYGNSMSTFIRETVRTRGSAAMFKGYFGIQYRQTSWTAAYFASLETFKSLSKEVCLFL